MSMNLSYVFSKFPGFDDRYFMLIKYMEEMGFKFREEMPDHKKNYYRIMENGSSVFFKKNFFRLNLCEKDHEILAPYPEYKYVMNYKDVSRKELDRVRPYKYDIYDIDLFDRALKYLADGNNLHKMEPSVDDAFLINESGYFPQKLTKELLGIEQDKLSKTSDIIPKREQREWILPCNTSFYDIHNALTDLKIIDWRQTTPLNNAQVGDIIYIYCKDKKVSEIRYKGAILAVNKINDIIDDSKYSSGGTISTGPCIEIAVFREYELTDALTYKKLKEHGLLSRLQGPTVVKGSVAEYLHECDAMQRQVDMRMVDMPDTCLVPFPIRVHEILNDNLRCTKPLDESHSYEEKESHAQSLSLDELKVIASNQQTRNPKVVKTTVAQTVRDPYIAEYAKKRANGVCQLCMKKAPFNRPDGEPYLESHHIVWLSEGGADSIGNTVALCPNCHKKMHIVNDQNDVNKLIEANLKSLSLRN